MELVPKLVIEGGKCLLSALKAPVDYLVNYRKKVDKLSETLGVLVPMRNDLERSIEAASRRGEVINEVASNWRRKVDELKEVEHNLKEKLKANKRCFHGCCPDLAWRYRLGKEASKKVVEAEELLNRHGQFINSISQPPRPPPPIFESMPAGEFMAFSSTRKAMQKVMDALEDGDVHLIGIWGMGGVGKTTLMEEVGRRVKESNMFPTVVKVDVSQNPDLGQIRRSIAYQLGFTLTGDGDSAAASLAERLKMEKKVLIMMDDIWARLELKIVGIPYGDDHKGCKILLTTRKEQVCQTMEADIPIKVDVLSTEDSWKLFKSKAGDVIESPDLGPCPREVARECGGLPLAIVVVGRALRGRKRRDVWDAALSQLRQSIPRNLVGVEEKLFQCLELSYNYIKDVETKRLFLFCCLFHEDHSISEDELTSYALGEGFLGKVSTLKDARDRIVLLVEELVASCLLIRTDKDGYVKMHDVVRDVAIYIASKEEDPFFIKAGIEMRYWPENENLMPYKRISLMNSCLSALPDQPKCPNLWTLLLNFNLSLVDMPHNFFIEMSALTVLDISDTNISSLPPSLKSLRDLRTLRLDRCPKLRDISLVGQLNKLKILGLQKCPVEVLPEEIGSLVSLELLDLSSCTSLKIPPNVMRKLCRLEELYMRSCVINEALLIEIASLKCLVRLQLYVRDVKFFSQENIHVDAWMNLRHFIIYTEFDWFVSANVHQKNFYLKGVTLRADWAKVLLSKTEDLKLDGCTWDSTNLARLDEHTSFSSLKKLHLEGCHHIECLLDTTQGEAPLHALEDVEVLELCNLENFIGIYHGMLPVGSFRKIRMLDITSCKKLVDIMPQNFLLRVHRTLEELMVKQCEEPHKVFDFEGLEEGNAMLPKLCKLVLHCLPNLNSIWNGDVPPGSLQNLKAIELTGCNRLGSVFSQQLASGRVKLPTLGTFANLKELKIWRCECLKYLFSPSLANELRNLERLELGDNDGMQYIIGGEDGVELDENAFPLLKDLWIINMSMLKSFYNGEPVSISLKWSSLRHVKLGQCQSLRRLPIGPGTAPKLKKVYVEGNDDIAWFHSLEWEDKSVPSRFQICQLNTENDSD